jgi:hypothetical protein
MTSRLTLAEAEQVILEGRHFPGQERCSKFNDISTHLHSSKNGWQMAGW